MWHKLVMLGSQQYPIKVFTHNQDLKKNQTNQQTNITKILLKIALNTITPRKPKLQHEQHLETTGVLTCPRRVSSSCSTDGTHRVNQNQNLVNSFN